MKFDLDKFLEECHAAIGGSDSPVSAVKRVMQNAIAYPASILRTFPAEGEDEILLHNSDNLTVFRVLLHHGLQFPPHDHRMPVVIGLYSGCETNSFYSRSKDNPSRLEHTGHKDIEAPQVHVLKPDAIHAVSNLRPEPSAALHVYLGDLIKQKRTLWTLDLDGEQPFVFDTYHALSRKLTNVAS